MGKKIYVNGGILIDTPFFTCCDGGALFDIQPEGAGVLETNCIIENHPCLKIDDNNPQGTEKERMQKMRDKNLIGHWEQAIIEYAMRTSYSNIKTIKSSYKKYLTSPSLIPMEK